VSVSIWDVGPRDGLQSERDVLERTVRAELVNRETEDLVYLLHGEGVERSVDLGALISVAGWPEGVLGRPLPGQAYGAGTFAPMAA
jgi:isopropylmalate/homocitrate/citramalate synthase